MTATFVVEDGSIVTGANALVSIADADQIMENYGNSTDWSGSTEAEKQTAIRLATRYLNIHYIWDGYKVDEDQTCQWPRYDMTDEDGNDIDYDIVHQLVKEACAYLALKVIDGDTLIPDFDNEANLKRTKDVIGPITEEREYTGVGESPEKTYQIVDKLLAPFILGEGFYETELERG